MLRKERLAQDLDQSRAAAQLHLTHTMIEALETDDFVNLPGPVFTQGYLRNYARLLGIPEKEVLDAYQRIRPQPDTDELSVMAAQSVRPEVSSSHRLVQLLTWLIVFGLLGLLIIWWQGHLNWQAEPLVDEQSTPQSDDMPVAVMEDEMSFEPAGLPSLPSDPDTDLAPVEKAPAAPEPDKPLPALQPDEASLTLSPPPESEAALSPPTASVDELPASSPLPSQRPQEFGQTAPQASPTEIQAPTAEPKMPPVAPPQQPSVDDGLMVFEFQGPCWAEVRDSTGKAHIIGEMAAGDRRTVPANLGPYKIVLGNVKVARLTINGKPFDLASITRGVVARFTLDPSQL
jgi:cytoskeleton protein RodZ